MRYQSRMRGLWRRLTAKERAIAALKSLKARKPEEPLLRQTMPDEQIPEFNHHISLIHGLQVALTPLAFVCSATVEAVRLRLALLGALGLWGMYVKVALHYIRFECPELITQSEFDCLQKEASARDMSLDEAAEILADEYEDWAIDDLERDEAGQEFVTDSAWERVLSRKRAELEALIGREELAARESDEGSVINVGSFYAWREEQVPIMPEWGMEYDVRPDGEAETVERRREWLEYVCQISRSVPMLSSRGPSPRLTPPCPEPANAVDNLGAGDELPKALADRVRSDVETCWSEVQALELVIGEVADVFGGEDPLLPQLRQILDGSVEQLKELSRIADPYTGPLELPGPSQAMANKLRAILGHF